MSGSQAENTFGRGIFGQFKISGLKGTPGGYSSVVKMVNENPIAVFEKYLKYLLLDQQGLNKANIALNTFKTRPANPTVEQKKFFVQTLKEFIEEVLNPLILNPKVERLDRAALVDMKDGFVEAVIEVSRKLELNEKLEKRQARSALATAGTFKKPKPKAALAAMEKAFNELGQQEKRPGKK